MAGSSEGYHEPMEKLKPSTLDFHRAIVSLMEELEAVDWYQQRVDACGDPELAEVLAHNRDEEKEHAAMILEWLRRHDAGIDENLREYLFIEGSIAHHEEEETGGAGAASATGSRAGDASLGIGSLRSGGKP